MKIMVIGGEGFIGRHLMEQGKLSGHDMISVDCSGEPTIKKLSGELTPKDLEGIDRVIWSAGELGTVETFEHPTYTIDANITDVVKMLELCRVGKTHFTYITLGNDWLNPYTITKNCAAKFCEMYWKVHGVPVQIAVTYNVFGPYQKTHPVRKIVPYFMTQLLKGEPVELFGSGMKYVDMVYAPDLAKEILFQSRKEYNDSPGIVHYGTGKPMTIMYLLNQCEKLFGYTASVNYLDERLGETSDSAISPFPTITSTPFDSALKQTAMWYKLHRDE